MGRRAPILAALPLAMLASPLLAGPSDPPSGEETQVGERVESYPFTGAIPAEFRGLWAYSNSRCVDGEHRRVPESGIFVGNVTFGTFTRGMPDPGQSIANGYRRTGERQLSVAMGPGTEPQLLTLTDEGLLIVQWGERGPFEFIRCSPVEE